MVDQVVSMNEQVSEGNNPRVISHSGSYIRVITGQAIHCLADNFEVAFHRRPQQWIGLIVLKGLAR
jgi:hypothetical protein